MAMSRTVEITILSAENLQMNKKPIRGNTFVTVQSDASSDTSATKVDSEGGSYPSWNEKLVMDAPLHARFITVEVKCKTSSTGSNSVGVARIPVSDFVGGYVPENQLHFLSYRLWDGKVRRNGVVNVSVRVKVAQQQPQQHLCNSNSTSLSAVTGVPVAVTGAGHMVGLDKSRTSFSSQVFHSLGTRRKITLCLSPTSGVVQLGKVALESQPEPEIFRSLSLTGSFMATKPKVLELTVLSAEGLHVRGKPANKNVFTVVRAESLTSHTTAMANGNENGFHTWNEKFRVELGPQARCLTIEVKCKTETGVVRDIGVARIAVSDFLGGSVPDHSLQSLCYRLRDWDGRENGVVNFSVRVAVPPAAAENDCSSSSGGVVTAIPLCAYLLSYTKILIDMEAKSHSQTLEITVMSGENVSVDQSSVAANVYVVVGAESLNSCTTKMVNEDGGVHAWNETFLLDVPSYARSVTFEVQCKKYKGVRPIGVARIALSDFLGGNNVVSESVPQMYCYGLRNWEGRRNGVIHFSVRVVTLGDNLCSETKEEKETKMVNSKETEHEVMGFQVNSKNSNDVVIGIPVRWSYQSAILLLVSRFGGTTLTNTTSSLSPTRRRRLEATNTTLLSSMTTDLIKAEAKLFNICEGIIKLFHLPLVSFANHKEFAENMLSAYKSLEAKSHSRILEITVMSGENISVDRSSVAANVYVVVRAESLNSCTTKMVNGDGGVHAWNEKFLLGIPSYARSVTFEVQCMNYKGVRPIGVARIALSDLLSNNTKIVSESVPQMLCYGLRNWEGRRNGVIHFSVRMVAPGDNLCSETKQEKEITTVNYRGIEHEVMGIQVEAKNSTHVAIGIPVWWSYQNLGYST
ncbi:BON1-associated protein 2 [Glycine max]|nr:BON1-associated protein 2 [Glycine max]